MAILAKTTDIVEVVALQTGSSKKASKEMVDSVLAAARTLIEDTEFDGLYLNTIGTIKKNEVAARDGRNPQTGEDLVIPAHKRLAMKFSKSLKDEVR
jgi:DNA-binding protein HU-beta